MEKQSWKLFPTPVNYFTEVLSPEQLKIICRHCIAANKTDHDAFFGGAKSSFSKSSRLIEELESQYKELTGLKKGLTTLFNEYGKELGFKQLSLTNSWFNVQYPGSILKHHVHPESKASAALCIVSDEKSSKLYLENPNPFLNFIRPDTYNENSFEFIKLNLAPGDLVLFPSWIKHGSGAEPNESEMRVVISINAI